MQAALQAAGRGAMEPYLLAVLGLALALVIIFGCAAIPVRSGDPVIQPEGEPDPGKHTAGLFAGRADDAGHPS